MGSWWKSGSGSSGGGAAGGALVAGGAAAAVGAGAGVHRHELTVLGVRVQPSQPQGTVCIRAGTDSLIHGIPDVLVRHRAEPFDECGIGVGGSEQGTIGDDHPEVHGAGIQRLTAEQGLGEQVRHDLGVTASITVGAGTLRGDGESFADPRGPSSVPHRGLLGR